MASDTPEIVLVVARARNGVIGKDDALPWRIAEDMRRFKQLTLGRPIIMGRKTWQSLPKKPLPGRINIVLSRAPSALEPGAILAATPERALELAAAEHPAEIAIIGGSQIYAAFLPMASRIELTEIDAAFAGDAFLPAFDPKLWQETGRQSHVTSDGLSYAFVTLVRRQQGPCLHAPAG